MNKNLHHIIRILNDGSIHSGNDLGAALNITRSAIWKLINQLTELGLPIVSIPGKGYYLEQAIELLNIENIKKHLIEAVSNKQCQFDNFDTIDSTNTYLAKAPPLPHPHICLAEQQTHGKGRSQRTWHSPFAKNIYCSIKWPFIQDASSLAGLSLVVSLSVIKALKNYGITQDLQLKWPNDILWQQQKLSGILIELLAESFGNCYAIIGIGLNVNMQNESAIDQPWTSVMTILGQTANRNQLTALLINELVTDIELFAKAGLAPFLSAWQRYDSLYQKEISLCAGNQMHYGVASGINVQGYLLLRDKQGNLQSYSAGDVNVNTIRPCIIEE